MRQHIASRSELTEAEARAVIARLQAEPSTQERNVR